MYFIHGPVFSILGYGGLRGMWVDGGCRGDFVVDGSQPIACACIGSQGFCQKQTNCSADALHCAPPFSTARNVTVIGIAADGSAHGSHSLLTGVSTKAAKLELRVDVPSLSTGTGSALYLDGQDVAFIRAQLVDAAGVLVRGSDVNLTYSVVSGPVRLVGTGSGSIRNHQHVNGDTYETWQGLGRAVFQATLDCTSEHRDLAEQIDVDASAQSPRTYAASCVTAADMAAVVRAVSADGTLSATAARRLFFPRPIPPCFPVLARACLLCLGARMWRVDLLRGVKSIPNPRLTPRILFSSWHRPAHRACWSSS